MAQTMIRNSVLFGGSRGVRRTPGDPMECLSQAQETGDIARSSEDISCSKRLGERPACTGWNCEYIRAGPIKEPNYERSEDRASMEEDILTYLLNDPDSVTEALRLGSARRDSLISMYLEEALVLPFNRLLWHACHYLAYHDRQIRCSAILSLFSRSPK